MNIKIVKEVCNMNSNIKALIFDLDGVLVFTDELHYQAWKTVADRLKIPFDREINNRLRGVSRMESLDIILERSTKVFDQTEKEEIAEEKNRLYREKLQQMTPDDVSTDVRKKLEELKADGYLLAIGSSSKNTKLILQKVNLLDSFDAISDGTNITRSKPDPEVFLKAAEFLHMDPEKCAVIEDAKAGIDAAKAAGMTAIGIGDAATYEKADYKIQYLTDLV